MCQGNFREDVDLRLFVHAFKLTFFEQDGTFLAYELALLFEIARYGLAKLGVDDEMHAGRRFGIQPAQLLETATGTGFETLPTVPNAMLDGRIIADIEMEKRPVFESPPITAIQDAAATNIKSASDDMALVFGED
jgi:hypothetical protein